MRRFRGMVLLLVVLIFFLQAQPAAAQNLFFEVPRQIVTVIVNSDGSLTIDYLITFNNLPGAAPIDIIDIGMPNYSYSIDSMTADVNGQPVGRIRDSQYVSPGIEVHLEDQTIQPGTSGTFHLRVGRVDYALGQGTAEESEPYASLEFSPNYFGSEYVTGNTNYTFTIVLPAGIEPEQPRYYTPSSNWPGADEPTASYDSKRRVVYTWTSEDADLSSEYIFGASFPMALVPAEVVIATETPNTRSFNLEDILPCACFGGIILFIFGTAAVSIANANKRRLQYLPPKIAVEGHGIKRGLTAVEAAILMEQPLDKVMTMILFSVLKKGAATVETREPLKLTIAERLPDGLQPYEDAFLAAFKIADKRAQRNALQDMTIALVKSVSEKMKGFSRKETIEYYKAIIEKAWQQVTAAETPEVKSEKYEEVMDWTMLDRQWEGRTRDTFGTGPIIVPTWWWRYDPVVRSSGSFGGAAQPAIPSQAGSGSGSITLPKLPGSDFAASMAQGIQNFSSGVIGDVTNFTSNITNKTNPVPKTTYTTRSGGGGGGGCACACACACAGCACACAGGGR